MIADLLAPIRTGPLRPADVVPATGAELRASSFRYAMDNLRYNSRREVISGVMDDVIKPLYQNLEDSTGESDLYNKARAIGHRKMMSVGGQPPEAQEIEYGQYLALKEDLEKRGVTDIPAWETIKAGAQARANVSREEFEIDMQYNMSSAPWFQSMLGQAGAATFYDPVQAGAMIATLPLGLGAPLKIAGAEMLATTLAQVPVQINVAKWQQELGQEYTTEDAVRSALAEILTVGLGTAALAKGLNIIGFKTEKLIAGPDDEVQRVALLRDALIHRKMADGTLFQPLQTPVETIYDVADRMPISAERDSLWATARDIQLLNSNPAARLYDDGVHMPTGREQELHNVNMQNSVRSMATGEELRVQYEVDLAPDLFKVSDEAVAVDRVVELEAENIVPDITTRAYQRKLAQWVRDAFMPRLLNSLDEVADLAAKRLPSKPAKTAQQLANSIAKAEEKLAKLQADWKAKMPAFNRQIVETRATKTAKNLTKQRQDLKAKYQQDVRETRRMFNEARKEHGIVRGTKDFDRSRKAENRKVTKLTKAFEKERDRLAKLTDEAANAERLKKLNTDKAQYQKDTDVEMQRLRNQIAKGKDALSRRKNYDSIKSAKTELPKLERQISMLERGRIPAELKGYADEIHAGVERRVGTVKRYEQVTIEPEAEALIEEVMTERVPRKPTPPPQMRRDHEELLRTVPERETAAELEERATKLYEAASERSKDRVRTHIELSRTVRSKRVMRDAVRDFYNRVNYAAERKIADMMGALDTFADEVAAKGLRLLHNREFMLKVTEGMINGVESVPSLYRPVIKQLKELMQQQLEEFRALGGHIGELEGYFPLRHDRKALKAKGFEAWYTAYEKMNDLSRIVDFETGAPMTPARFKEISKNMFDEIVNDGYGTFKTPGGTIARRMETRFSRPKDYAAYMEYSKEFGAQEGDLYTLLVSNLRDMAHDLAIMRELGPKPGKVHQDLLEEFGVGMDKAERDYIDGYFRTLVAHWSGDTADNFLARSVQGAMDLASHLLGSAPVAAMGDPIFLLSTARLNGLSQSGAMKAIGRVLKQIGNDPDEVVRQYHVAEALLNSSSQRFSAHGDMGGMGKVNNTLADMKNLGHRLSGLHQFTLMMADAMSIDFASELGTRIATKTAWDALDPKFQRLLRLNEVTADDWGRLLDYPVDERGMVWGRMLPDDMADIARKIGNTEMELRSQAINAPDLRSRVYATGNRWGPRVRGDKFHLGSAMTMQFKSFMVQVWANHLMPSVQHMLRGDGAGPLMALLATGAVVGTGVIQLREMVKGNPALPMDDFRTYVKGLMQSGVGGILGDMMLKDPNQFRRDFLRELAGPVPVITTDIAMEIAKQTVGVHVWSADPYAEASLSPLLRAVRPVVPFSNLWYTKAGFDRVVTDTIDEMLDPGFLQRQAQQKARLMEERGATEAWWL